MNRLTKSKVLKHYRTHATQQTGRRTTGNNFARLMVNYWDKSKRPDKDILNTLTKRTTVDYD